MARVEGSPSRACTEVSVSVPILIDASPTGSRKYPRWFVTGTQPASSIAINARTGRRIDDISHLTRTAAPRLLCASVAATPLQEAAVAER